MSVAKEMKTGKAYYIKYLTGRNIPYIPNIESRGRSQNQSHVLEGDVNPKISFNVSFYGREEADDDIQFWILFGTVTQPRGQAVWEQFVNHIDKLTGKAMYNS